MFGLFWIIFSYILGSFPSGYIFGRLSGKKVLEIGWRKTSGSNVFKNVGIWQGLLTGVFDVGKGYLAVYLAQQLGFSPTIQIFAGAASVVGHNWSLFLNFAGGRGIGTFIGAFLAVSPQILGYAIIPLVVFAVVWDAAIGTILFLLFSIFIASYLNQFSTAGLFSIIILLPVFLKRLSPIAEIQKAQNKKQLIVNRLLFDDDTIHDFRIKRIFEKAKYGSQKATNLARPITGAVMASPKVGWKAAKYGAKYGVKIAKKPIDMVLAMREKTVIEIGVEELRRMIMAAAKNIVLHQEEINKINVFPVADKDTGYNLAATLLGVESLVSRKEYAGLRGIAKDIKDAAMVNARGNAGMIFTGYLIELLNKIDHLEEVNAFYLAQAMKSGAAAARRSVVNPVDGTILDIMQAAADSFVELTKENKEKNIIKLFEEGLKAGQKALKETPEKLAVLKQNHVVDAGGLGFVKIMESWLASLKGEVIVEEEMEDESPFVFEQAAAPPIINQKEVVFLLKESENLDIEEICGKLSALGDSIDVLESEGAIKIHIHTDAPDLVKEALAGAEIINWRVEDLIPSSEAKAKQPIGLVVAETAGLPRDFIQENQIQEVPFKINFSGQENAVEENFYQKLALGKKLPTTASAPFGEFFNYYKTALGKFEKILVIVLSSRLSGAYSQARIARSVFKKPEKTDIYVFDCFAVGPAEGLIIMKAQELISEGKNMEEIIEELKEFCLKVRLAGVINDIKYVISGGRFKLPKISIPLNFAIQKFNLRPILGLKDGKVVFSGLRIGKSPAEILAAVIRKEVKGAKIKVAISHADNLTEAENLQRILSGDANVEIAFISELSPVIGVHAGPKALLVAFHPVVDKP